jgi:hypothetical protein
MFSKTYRVFIARNLKLVCVCVCVCVCVYRHTVISYVLLSMDCNHTIELSRSFALFPQNTTRVSISIPQATNALSVNLVYGAQLTVVQPMSFSFKNFTHCDFLFFLALSTWSSEVPPPSRHPSTFMSALRMHYLKTLHYVTLCQRVLYIFPSRWIFVYSWGCGVIRVQKCFEPFHSVVSNARNFLYNKTN